MREKDNVNSVVKSVFDIFEKTKIDNRWSFAECGRKETAKWTHGYHRYPAKFIPQVVEGLFDDYIQTDNAHINDPFFGSGTTIVSALSRGYRASGTDINGIAFLMTKVKATPIDPVYLKRKVDSFLNRIKREDTGQTKLVEEDILPDIPQKHIERIDYITKTQFYKDCYMTLLYYSIVSSIEQNTHQNTQILFATNCILRCKHSCIIRIMRCRS